MAKSNGRAPEGGVRIRGRFYAQGMRLPKAAQQFDRERPPNVVPHDPAQGVPGAAPNMGRSVVPHAASFQSLVTNLAKVYRNPDQAMQDNIDNARMMRYNLIVKEPLENRARATALLPWHLVPEDEKDPKQRQLCKDLTREVNSIRRYTEYRRSLQEGAIWLGRQANENHFVRQQQNGKSVWVPETWTPVHGDKLCFRYDDGSGEFDPNQIGIRIRTGFGDDDTIAGNRKTEQTSYGRAYFLESWERKLLVVHKHMIEDGAYEDVLSAGSIHGIGIRSFIYWAWTMMSESLAQLVELVEKTGQGMWVYKYRAGDAKDLEGMEAIAQEQAYTNAIFIPVSPGDEEAFGSERIVKLEANTTGIDCLKDLNQGYWGGQVKRYILGQTLTTESSATGMNSNTSDVQQQTFYDVIRMDAANHDDTMTYELVKVLKDFNHPWARNVHIAFVSELESDEVEKRLQAMKMAWDMGADIKEQDVLDAIGAGIPDPGDKLLKNPAFQPQSIPGQIPGAPGQPPQPGGDPQVGGMSVEDMFGPLAKEEDEEPQEAKLAA